MDIGSAFTFAFDDQEWIKKLAIGGGLVLGGIILSPILVGIALFIIVLGYMIDVIKNVRDGQPTPLPEWTDFGGLFSKGGKAFVIGLVYNLPALLLSCGSAGVNIFATQPNVDGDVASTLAIVATCLSCVQILLSFLSYALLPAGIIRFVQFDTIGSAFQFGEIFGFIRANIGDYIIVVLLSLVAQFIAALGIILCVIGVFFTSFWSYLVTANLYGQLARKMTA